ncbi:MAG: hypothetical protein KGD59_12900 [Candidatus Heimdallarchaeota archaeon]|nr:hypothetical protein [Candidatus Heimdallarchaeota archaeon]MBY8995444.1 hypothetical protein [Candidatus Heimdallarchaeota archaeon]
MIQFVWIVIKDTPVAGMRFIKMSDLEERERLEKFYGWLSGPISEFTGKVQDIIIEGTKYYYHTNSEVLFVVGTDLEETSIPSVFMPELEDVFLETFPSDIADSFDGKDVSKFRVFDKDLVELVQAFDQRKIEAIGERKGLDAFEVLNLPTELQMVALVLVKMQVVTPDMVTQVTGLATDVVEQQLRDIYQRGYLYITSISEKSYFSIKPFESDEAPRIILKRAETKPVITDKEVTQTQAPITMDSSFPPETEPATSTPQKDPISAESAMMAPPDMDYSELSAESSFSLPKSSEEFSDISTISPILEEAKEPVVDTLKKELRGIKLKKDPIAMEIDKTHRQTIIIPKSGFLPSNSLRREKGFTTGKIRIPNDRNRDPFLLNTLFKKDLENLFEALFMGNFIVITGENVSPFEDEYVDKLIDALNLLTPHRDLICVKNPSFVHPKDADVVVVPKDFLKYYSWATIIDMDQNRIIGGSSSEFTKNLVRKLKKIISPKEFLKEITNSASILLKVARDINTLKIEGRSPDQYLNEVKKAFGVAALDAGLTLSEKLIRLHKDCAYIAGFYIRKGLDVAVRSIIVGDPLVIIGDDPLDVYHILEALSIFAPHKAISAQIWTTNFAGIDTNQFDIMGAQEGTDKLFKEAAKVNLRSMSAYGGPRSEYLHSFLRQMWRRRSRERPKFIRDKINEMFGQVNKFIQKIQAYGEGSPTKQEIRDMLSEFDPNFLPFAIDLLRNTEPELALKIKDII